MKRLFFFLCCLLWPLRSHAATLTFTWQDLSDNEDGFQMEAKCAPATEFTDRGTPVGPNIQTMQLFQLDNQLCDYRLYAYNIFGQSGRSNTVSVSTGSPPNAPGSLQKTASTAVRESSGAIAALQQKAQAQGKMTAVRYAKSALANNQQTLNLVVKAESQTQ